MSDPGKWGRNKRRWLVLFFLFVTYGAFGWSHRAVAQASSLETVQRPTIAIEEVTVVDVIGGKIDGPQTILIVDGRIAAIGKPGEIELPPETVRLAGRERYLIPGLVDMHVHLFNNATRRPPNEWAFPLFIANGVTAVREMAIEPAQMAVVNGWRSKVERGELVAPRVLAAGAVARAETATSVREQVHASKAAGVDFMKVFSDMQKRVWRMLLAEASAARLPVCGHIPGQVRLLEAAASGQRSNEHLTQVYEACSAAEEKFLSARQRMEGTKSAAIVQTQEREVLESFDQLACERVAAALARTDQVQVPTLVLSYFEAKYIEANEAWAKVRDDKRWPYLRADEQARWQRLLTERTDADKTLALRRWEVSRQIVQTLNTAGVRILAGTDAPMPLVYPGFALHQELELLVRAGMSTADALRSATIWPVEFLGQADQSGTIAIGKRADLVLLDENPLTAIENTQRVRAVILDGRVRERSALDLLLSATSRGEPAGALPQTKSIPADAAR
ncbi:MAG: amidohydrolase family protein [Chthoniobacterales bacterium]